MARITRQHEQRQARSESALVEHHSTTDKTLANYLDAMLHDATSRLEPAQETETSTPTEASPEVQVETRVAPTVVQPKAEPEPEPESLPEPEPQPTLLSPSTMPEPQVKVEQLTEKASEQSIESAAKDQVDPAKSWLANGRPAWAQERFECLMFVVDGLRLAVPLLLLGNIHPLDRPLTPLFDQPGWFLGLLSLGSERTIRVVDTAKLVMPERYTPSSAEQLGYAVGVYDSDWAFGCHQIEGSITLSPEQVKWRSSRTSRPWLAGTVIDEMCALVDLHAFSRALERGSE